MNQRARAASSRRAALFIALAPALTTIAALFAPTSIGAEPATPAASPPNVVVVVADDVGFSDLGAYGSEIRTPRIDAIASRGVMFSNFHVSPMCSPSRAMLLTGVDSHLAGVASLYVATPRSHRGRPGYEGELRTDVVTIASRLRDAGYRTYLSGKWNLGHTPTSLPSARGFDRTFALDATGADNFEKNFEQARLFRQVERQALLGTPTEQLALEPVELVPERGGGLLERRVVGLQRVKPVG